MVTAWFGPPLFYPCLHEAAAAWGAICRGPSRESWNPEGHGEGVRVFPAAAPAAQPGPGQNGAAGDIGVSSLPLFLAWPSLGYHFPSLPSASQVICVFQSERVPLTIFGREGPV